MAMNGDVAVEFAGAVLSCLTEELLALVREELPRAFGERRPKAVIVSRCFGGYAGTSRDRIVLGVEVRWPEEFRTSIVKLGTRKKAGKDVRGWQACTAGRDVASRIFVPVQECPLGGDRVAVLYRDAYTLFGPDRERSRPESLETVVSWAVTDDKPDPRSVERAIAHIYTDLARWFYPGAAHDGEGALAFYRARLQRALGRWVSPEAGLGLEPALALHADLQRRALGGDEPEAEPRQSERARRRQEMRRDAVWLLCGRDEPDGTGHAAYLDPYEYVAWALSRGILPPTLVGRSHGDLHGRNALVGVLRGEAEFPAVFDYGEMSADNVLAWDFVKLETELKVRLLPELYRDEPAREALLAGRSWRARERTAAVDVASDAAGRADRLDFAYQFEALLAEQTAQVQGRADAELLQPPGGRRSVVGDRKLDRLLALLLRVRQEAALWLGYERGQPYEWREEYYFALAVYGLATAKWDYEPRQTECALVSAGVAAAQLQQARETILAQVADGKKDEEAYPSYRVPLAIAHGWWKAGRIQEALALLERVRPLYEQAVPLQQEYALLVAEERDHREAQRLLDPWRALCRLFGDHETLCRLGASYKRNGDLRWQSARTPFARLAGSPTEWMYRQALLVYAEAFELTRHYYPGVNAATLALLVREGGRAAEYAGAVLEVCQARRDQLPEDGRFWLFASAGEAALVLGRTDDAVVFYETALEQLEGPSRAQLAQTAYDQVCRLWYVLGRAPLGPVIDVFGRSPLWPGLGEGPLGDCDGCRRRQGGQV
jgi:hypothetical protein